MKRVNGFFFAALVFAFLVGCDEARNLQYYVLHPLNTVKVIKQCQKNSRTSTHCQLALKAYRRLTPYITVAWKDSQALGWDILQKQVALQQQQNTYHQVSQKLEFVLHSEDLSDANGLRARRTAIEQDIAGLQEEIHIMLAVIRDTVSL